MNLINIYSLDEIVNLRTDSRIPGINIRVKIFSMRTSRTIYRNKSVQFMVFIIILWIVDYL
jgi:hypothetical protein